MATLQELREEQLELKIEKSEICNRIHQIKSALEHPQPPAKANALRDEHRELSADQAKVDGEIATLNARVLLLTDRENARSQHLDHIRQLACAALAGGYDQDDVVWLAAQINSDIEALIPVPQEIREENDEEENEAA